MSVLHVQPSSGLYGQTRLPGDKSISHRAFMLGALAEGVSHIEGFLPGGDCIATVQCMRDLGIEIHLEGLPGTATASSIDLLAQPTATIYGRGLHGLRAPDTHLNCVRSGTTMRLLAGVLAGQEFESVLTGESQLCRRPMRRITEPLRAMGAEIQDTDGRAPLVIHGQHLHGFEHTLTVASAQVKSAILLAGLFAEGETTVHQCGPARDHTERMLLAQAVDRASRKCSPFQDIPLTPTQLPNHPTTQPPIYIHNLSVTLNPAAIDSLAPLNIVVPGDLSSAAFPLVAALLIPDSEIMLEGIGVNPTRTGLLDVLARMGAGIGLSRKQVQGGEAVADLTVRTSDLSATEISGDTVVRMIDEFPILAVAATQAQGTTLVRDARELRVKETDRIATVAEELGKLGAQIEVQPEGFIVEGPTPLHGGTVHSHGDHRLGMALTIAGLIASDTVSIEDTDCIADSFPGFAERMVHLGAKIKT